MAKYFEETVTRMNENLSSVLAWAKGEEELGLKSSLFICEKGVLTQYVDSDEGERFFDFVKKITTDEFDIICEEFFKAIENKDLVKMHKALAIFDELDNYSEFIDGSILRRLKRVRESTHEESYKFKDEGEKTFIVFKGEVWKKYNGN